MSKEVVKLECPWLKEVGVKEICDFKEMFKRKARREDCLYCLASTVETSLSHARISERDLEELKSTLLRYPEKILILITTLKVRDRITTTELSKAARLPFSDIIKLSQLLPVKAIRRAKGYRWTLSRRQSTKEAK